MPPYFLFSTWPLLRELLRLVCGKILIHYGIVLDVGVVGPNPIFLLTIIRLLVHHSTQIGVLMSGYCWLEALELLELAALFVMIPRILSYTLVMLVVFALSLSL